MSNVKLNKEERKILEDFEAGKLKCVKNFKNEKKHYQESARYTLSKARNINIRLSARDLQKIKALAAEMGLPYQTFISSLLHQYSSRRAKEDTF